MCGIIGYFGQKKILDKNRFEDALDLIKHRGPDDRGIYFEKEIFLGHRRLSIIDLSKAGRQPMTDKYSGAVITFNGEIYNYVEMRNILLSKGYTFFTKTDTEVLLKCYLEWKNDCVKYLNGMWSFAIWDPNEKKVFFSRDRFGVKPFYYCFNSKNEFFFSSEPKAINKLIGSQTVNEKTLYDFIVNGKHYNSNMSYYKNISILPSSSCGTYNLRTKNLKIWQYWQYPSVEKNDSSFRKNLNEFSDLFDDSVKIRLRSDVPVGITYSGGIDSTSILTSMVKNKQNFTAFTSIYSKNERGEENWAKLGVKGYDGVSLKSIMAPYDNWFDTLREIIWHLDGPGYSPAVYPLWCLMKEAKNMKIPVLLEGQGADEELGGYTWYSVLNLINVIANLIQNQNLNGQSINKILIGIVKAYGIKESLLWFLRELHPSLLKVYRYKIGLNNLTKDNFYFEDSSKNPFINKSGKDVVTKRMREDHSSNILPGLLHYGDAVSMAHSIESRHPFLDYRLVEWLFKQPDNVKFYNGISKYISREYLKKNNQIKIANRYDKKGYPIPISRWLLHNDAKILNETILSPNAKINNYVKPKELVKLTKKMKYGDQNITHHLYKLISIEIWLNECF